jgi:hypothetical protein
VGVLLVLYQWKVALARAGKEQEKMQRAPLGSFVNSQVLVTGHGYESVGMHTNPKAQLLTGAKRQGIRWS